VARRIGVGKTHPFARQLVDCWGLVKRTAVTSQIVISKIIHQKENHVWLSRCLSVLNQQENGEHQNQQSFLVGVAIHFIHLSLNDLDRLSNKEKHHK
jgi:hypothetical protein